MLALLLRHLGTADVARHLSGIDLGLFALAIGAVQVQILVSALRWRFTSERIGQPLPATRAVGEYYLATLLNQVLPGGVAGDAVRVVRSSRRAEGERRTRLAAQAVVLERLSGQAVLFAFALAGLAAVPLVFGARLPGASGWLPSLGAALAAATLLAILARGWIGRVAGGFGPVLAEVFVRRGAAVIQLLTSIVVIAAYLAAFALSAAAVGAPIGVAGALFLVPLVLLSMLLPVSVGGWGVREAAAAAILPLSGIGAGEAFAASVVYGLASLVGALPGLAVLASHFARGRRRAPA